MGEIRIPFFGLEKPEEVAAILSWRGTNVYEPAPNMLSLAEKYLTAAQQESCGRCIPCRMGSKLALDIVKRLAGGEQREEDVGTLERVLRLVQAGSKCEFGRSFPRPILEMLRTHPELFRQSGSAPNGYKFHILAEAPCQNACPAGIDIPTFIREIQDGHFEHALAVIRESTALVGVLGRICPGLCERNCRRNNLEAPLNVHSLKRFVADFEAALHRRPALPRPAPREERVAIVGAGPAGLSCAYQLARRGYQVTIFEALPVAGGMLAVGIPPYRLPRDVLDREIELIRSLGVDIKLGVRVGKDITVEELRQRFQAVFIAAGLHESATMGAKGEEAGYEGFIPGVKYLRNLSLNLPVPRGRKVAVIGGGNVAMDCARSSLRLGFEKVYLIYRRTRAEMPANEHEIEDAGDEGVEFHYLANPTEIVARNGRVKGLQCIRMELGEPDASGRRRPVPVPGSEFFLECDVVIPAVGQVADLSLLEGAGGVKVTKQGTIAVDPVTLATDLPGVFAGGDLAHGARTAVEAVGAGNRAARAIIQYLEEGGVRPSTEDDWKAFLRNLPLYDPEEKVVALSGRQRIKPPVMRVEERVNSFAEVEFSYPNELAMAEADRCLGCKRLILAATREG